MTARTGYAYCAQELRRYDHDRYLTCLFAPPKRREQLFALYAFNLEVAKTAEVVSEPMLGHIRLQWWREAIAALYEDAAPRHEVIRPLAETVAMRQLTRAHFNWLLDTREFDLEGETPSDLGALERYAEGTSATLVWLALEILGARGEAAGTVGCHVGIAWALAGLLRAIPYHARQKRTYLPRDICKQAGLRPTELFELRSTSELARAVEPIAQRARDHVNEARRLRGEVPRSAIAALLPATLADDYLARLGRADHDPFRPEVQMQPPGRIWYLSWAALTRRY